MTETAPIPVADLEAMLLDPDVPDEVLRPYLIESASESGSFAPVVRINPATVEESILEAAVLLSPLNGLARRRRQERYRRKIASGSPLRIVSEGDSWFQYPFLLKDVIDHLFDHHALFCLSAAGDLVSEMVDQSRELVAAIAAEDPAIILLSGGGNDLLGDGRLASALLPFEEGRRPEDYLGEAFRSNLSAILRSWEELLTTVRSATPSVPIVCHSYDHAIPKNGRWLGKPLQRLGIVDSGLQRALIQLMVDQFHMELAALLAKLPQAHLVDCRGVVRGRWHDELHPDNAGYRDVAARFGARIDELTGRSIYPVPDRELESLAEVTPARDLNPREIIESWPAQALVAEIGLRSLSERADDNDLSLSVLSLEVSVPAFEDAAEGLLADARKHGIASLHLPPNLALMVEVALATK
jgi:lysophospholipase L1-like esterase